MNVDAAVRFPGDRAPDDVHDPEDRRPLGFRLTERGQRIGGLAALADEEHHVVDVDDAGPGTGIPTHIPPRWGSWRSARACTRPPGPACHEVPQAVMMNRRALRSLPMTFWSPPSFTSPSSTSSRPRMRVADRLGLLVDLLHHEVVVPAPLDLGELEA